MAKAKKTTAKKTTVGTVEQQERKAAAYALRTLAADIEAGKADGLVLGVRTARSANLTCPIEGSSDRDHRVGYALAYDFTAVSDIASPVCSSELTVGLVARLASKVKFSDLGLFG